MYFVTGQYGVTNLNVMQEFNLINARCDISCQTLIHRGWLQEQFYEWSYF